MSRIQYPAVTIEGGRGEKFRYQITSVSSWEFGYTVEGQARRAESSCSITTPEHYRVLREWEFDHFDDLGELLAAS